MQKVAEAVKAGLPAADEIGCELESVLDAHAAATASAHGPGANAAARAQLAQHLKTPPALVKVKLSPGYARRFHCFCWKEGPFQAMRARPPSGANCAVPLPEPPAPPKGLEGRSGRRRATTTARAHHLVTARTGRRLQELQRSSTRAANEATQERCVPFCCQTVDSRSYGAAFDNRYGRWCQQDECAQRLLPADDSNGSSRPQRAMAMSPNC
jgi:hypothetical protein